jgi:tRNA(Ile2)-agmatinylcytidine synthase
MHIGFDDTDSTRQGCTTYVAALLVEELLKLEVTFLDYPLLVRLNPNVPWKTRGNGALCLRIEYEISKETAIKELAVNLVETHSDIEWRGTDPGIVFLKSENVSPEITLFAKKAETTIVTIEEALQLIRKFKAEALGYNTQQGIIGALAAIGETLQNDHTYELISYRKKENLGSKRRVNEESIFKMDETLQPHTFNNVDTEKRRVIITPRGPDPILFGIRGETPQVVKQAFSMVKVLEPIERWMVFRSNQGTDAHFSKLRSIDQAQPYSSIIAKGTVSRNPQVIPGRHVIFSIKDETTAIDCAAYEPTGSLRKIARELMIGDQLEVYGAVCKPTANKLSTVNLEKINILKLVPEMLSQNPTCPDCCKRLKSMGKNQGLRCSKCGKRFSDMKKIVISKERCLKTGLYVTCTRSQRHLTKPLRRYGQEKHEAGMVRPIEGWYSISSP